MERGVQLVMEQRQSQEIASRVDYRLPCRPSMGAGGIQFVMIMAESGEEDVMLKCEDSAWQTTAISQPHTPARSGSSFQLTGEAGVESWLPAFVNKTEAKLWAA